MASALDLPLLDGLPDPVFLYARDGRYRYVNDAAARWLGRPKEAFIGRTGQELGLPSEGMARLDAQRDEALRSGTTIRHERYAPSLDSYIEYTVSLVQIPHEQPGLTLVIVRDVDARVRAVVAERIAMAANMAINAGLDVDATCHQLARSVVWEFASCCVIDLVDANGAFVTDIIADADPELEAHARAVRAEHAPYDREIRFRREVLGSRKLRRLPTVNPADWRRFARNDAHADALAKLGFRSIIVAPLYDGETPLGTIGFGRRDREFTGKDERFVVDIAGRTAAALGAARARARAAASEAQVVEFRTRAQLERERFHEALQRMPAAIAIVRGGDYVYELSNPLNDEIAGQPLTGRNVLEALPELAGQGLIAIADRVMSSGEPFLAQEFPVDVDTAQGRRRYFLSGGYMPLRGPEGVIDRFLSFAYDVSSLVHARQRLESITTELEAQKRDLALSEARAQRLFRSGIIGIVYWTNAGVIIDANDAFLDMLGYTRQDLLDGKIHWRNMTPPEFAAADEQAFEEMRARGWCKPFEKAYYAKDGKRVDVLIGAASWDEPVEHGVAWVVDITERRLAERERARAVRTLDVLARAGALLSSSLEVDDVLQGLVGLVVPTLAEFCVIFLRDDGKLVARALRHRDEATQERLRRVVENLGTSGFSNESSRLLAASGTVFLPTVSANDRSSLGEDPPFDTLLRELEPTSWISVPLVVRGVVLGILAVGCSSTGVPFTADERQLFEDLAHRAALAIQNARVFAQSQRDREQAEAASRAKDEFLSTLSHELRTPLSAMIGWSALLRTGSLSDEQRERAIETIERNARMQARLVEDLLDVSRVIQGKLRLNVGPIDLVAVIERALDAVRPSAEAKSVRLQPVLDSHALVVGDPDRLQQVVWNLLSNAIKFTPKGGRVQIRLQRRASHVEIAVADTGQGIDPNLLPHVFERFWQAEGGTKRRHGGLGLGLAIVRSLVELHGGTVDVHSDGLDRGAEFTVTIPLAPVRARPGEDHSHDAQAPTISRRLEGVCALVVDDEPDTRELVAFVLQRAGCRTEIADGMETALASLRERKCDVLISDIGMPGGDGFELISRLRGSDVANAQIPAIALTAYARSVDRTRALEAGFWMHLSKPIDADELLVAVERVVGLGSK